MTFLGTAWWICKLIFVICVLLVLVCVFAGLVKTLADIIKPERKIHMKAHERGIPTKYLKYENDQITIGDMLKLQNEAKMVMVNKITEEYGKDVEKWPTDIRQEMSATIKAADMVLEVMMALHADTSNIPEGKQL